MPTQGLKLAWVLRDGLWKRAGYVSRGLVLSMKDCLCPEVALSAPPVVSIELPP